MAVADIHRLNALRLVPWQTCVKCGSAAHPRDIHDLFGKHCTSCGINRLEEIVQRIVRRKGPKSTIKALKRLARGK